MKSLDLDVNVILSTTVQIQAFYEILPSNQSKLLQNMPYPRVRRT